MMKTETEKYVYSLAKKHNVKYEETNSDRLAKKFTELSDNEVSEDDTRNLLIALKRKGIIDNKELIKLTAKHLKELKEK